MPTSIWDLESCFSLRIFFILPFHSQLTNGESSLLLSPCGIQSSNESCIQMWCLQFAVPTVYQMGVGERRGSYVLWGLAQWLIFKETSFSTNRGPKRPSLLKLFAFCPPCLTSQPVFQCTVPTSGINSFPFHCPMPCDTSSCHACTGIVLTHPSGWSEK